MRRCILAALAASIMAHVSLGGVETTLSILSYNVYMMPIPLFPTLGQNQRAKLIATSNFIQGHDVLIFQEVWDMGPRNILTTTLKDQYPYWTNVIGRTEDEWDYTTGRTIQEVGWNGGVMIMSKWPIVERRQHLYTACCGLEWLAHKGFAYVQLNRTGTPIHVIGTHLQSEDNLCAHPDGVATVQRAQLGELRTFIDQLNIPPTELVIAGGDFNINRGSAEYHILLSKLQADPPTSWSGAPFSWDADRNSLAVLTSPEESRLQYLDYILTFATHAKVASNVQKAINIQAPLIVDLNKEYHDYSDHYPVISLIHAVL